MLTEGKREKDSDLVRKTKLLVFSEDFDAFFAMVRKTAEFVRSHPVPEKVRRQQEKFWKQRDRRKGDAPAKSA